MGNAACCGDKDKQADLRATTGADELLKSEAVPATESSAGLSKKPALDVPPVAEEGTYDVNLDKAGNGQLGLDVDYMAERSVLPIIGITGGLAQAWNSTAPATAKLRKGDSIVEVNGTRGSALALLEKCKQEQKLHLIMGRSLSYDHLVTDLESLIAAKQCGPILIRLSWHDAGVFAQGKGGCPNAALRFPDRGEGSWAANAGLPTVACQLLGQITRKYVPALISHADLWALAANVAIKAMGGPEVPTRFGRPDAKSAADGTQTNDARLPDGDKGADHLRAIFGPKGFDDRDIVALSGAHTVGTCHLDRSGFDGKWTENPLVFDNSYFKELCQKEYTAETTKEGKPQHRHAASGTMMLPSDLALLQDPGFKRHVEEFSKDQNAFFTAFSKAWIKLQENGCETLRDTL